MNRYLVATLAAPFASFGEEAGNAQRGTSDRPTRSALIGLAAAALGIRRDDAGGQARLAASFKVATWTLDAGTLLTDFHTYNSLPSARGRPATRAQALARKRDLATSITQREYRCDVVFLAGYRQCEAAAVTVEELEGALRAPVFTLCLGRKSCPPARPLNPSIREAETAADAVRAYARDDAWLRGRAAVGVLAAENRMDLGPSNAPERAHLRMDDPGDRMTWQFSARREYVRRLALDDATSIKPQEDGS